MVGPIERVLLCFWTGPVGQVLKGETAEVLVIPCQIVGSLSGKEALRSSEGEVACLEGKEDSYWV